MSRTNFCREEKKVKIAGRVIYGKANKRKGMGEGMYNI
jgi:hypothetical protein